MTSSSEREKKPASEFWPAGLLSLSATPLSLSAQVLISVVPGPIPRSDHAAEEPSDLLDQSSQAVNARPISRIAFWPLAVPAHFANGR